MGLGQSLHVVRLSGEDFGPRLAYAGLFLGVPLPEGEESVQGLLAKVDEWCGDAHGTDSLSAFFADAVTIAASKVSSAPWVETERPSSGQLAKAHRTRGDQEQGKKTWVPSVNCPNSFLFIVRSKNKVEIHPLAGGDLGVHKGRIQETLRAS